MITHTLCAMKGPMNELIKYAIGGAILLSLLGAASEQRQDGRFQISNPPNNGGMMYLSDSQTGKIWQPLKFIAYVGEPAIWCPVTRVNSDEERVRVLDAIGLKSTQQK